MDLGAIIILIFLSHVACEYKCTESDCHECIDDVCHLTCQGIDCNECPNGDCCNGENCNVCLRSVCCSTAKCTKCVIDNRKSCLKEASDLSACEKLVEEICGLNIDKVIVDDSVNYNNQHHNITTLIRLFNVINNTNVVDIPVVLNTTNVQKALLNKTAKGVVQKTNCCSVVHPQECYSINGLPNRVCFTRRHTECSRLCGNSTNIIIRRGQSGGNQCIVVAVVPYYYCGYYTTEDCSACYNCKNQDKSECSKDPKCSESCRSSILPERNYNIPYFIKPRITEHEYRIPPSQ